MISKRFLLVGSLLLCSSSYGQEQDASLKLGIGPGGLIVGGEFIMKDTPAEGFGGYFSMHSKDEDDGAPGLTALGATFKLSQRFGPYEVYLSPGIGIVNYDFGDDDDLLIGPRLAIGLHAELDANLGLGFENQKLYSYMGEREGLLDDSFLLTVRFSM
ncbi:hypothetical protein [Pseudobacteriovorax antillogorgiicola]|uniref:Outer membrane protein beta-barrel domain-containing protein n=1 Tax=Pseudobacteriovorax antillogorgiicola TaxID=1513793 RepID=A0A1Y6CPW4_9BACT|nr:hypothetical protein [Pseudobacteriovorax antillogorgiicola]TCS43493.1 hypothetical protein EDD56_13621 [Pseudobacteriovorax antillogorgiicola]SMF81194.1 hypothetical protein SAMN06296036_13625 [Pseudobacteriovorax antillogorgiicola]